MPTGTPVNKYGDAVVASASGDNASIYYRA